MPAKRRGTYLQVARALVAVAKHGPKTGLAAAQCARSPASRPVALRGDDGDDLSSCLVSRSASTLDDWDARAKALGGTVTRWPPDWPRNSGSAWGADVPMTATVTLQLLISHAPRVIRGARNSLPRVSVDPTRVTTDLRDARAAIKQALKTQAGDAR